MSKLIEFKPEHLLPLLNEPINTHLKGWFMSGVIYEIKDSVTFFYNDQVMFCGGITPYWEGRGQVWSVFSERSKHHFVPTFRVIRSYLNNQLGLNYRRIEMSVDVDFEIGKRRAEMLGFRLEVERAKQYLPNGKDCALYAMVRG